LVNSISSAGSVRTEWNIGTQRFYAASLDEWVSQEMTELQEQKMPSVCEQFCWDLCTSFKGHIH